MTHMSDLADLAPTVGAMRLAAYYRLPAGYTVSDVLAAVADDTTTYTTTTTTESKSTL